LYAPPIIVPGGKVASTAAPPGTEVRFNRLSLNLFLCTTRTAVVLCLKAAFLAAEPAQLQRSSLNRNALNDPARLLVGLDLPQLLQMGLLGWPVARLRGEALLLHWQKLC
jgi:hypothetical protein